MACCMPHVLAPVSAFQKYERLYSSLLCSWQLCISVCTMDVAVGVTTMSWQMATANVGLQGKRGG
eukprot:1649-Amphidinium_carterae.1